MRIAILSDAHGNPLGLAECLQAARRLSADAVWFLGDAVGYLPGERGVLDLLQSAGAVCQRGNHDAMVLGKRRASREKEEVYRHGDAVARLGPAGLATLNAWPLTREAAADGKRILAVHGRPEDPLEGYCYPQDDLTAFAALPFDVVVMGHTHRPFIRKTGSVLVVNVGSCGLPRDQGDSPAFALYDSVTHTATIYRVRVDPEKMLNQFSGLQDLVHQSVKQVFYRKTTELVGEYIGGINCDEQD